MDQCPGFGVKNLNLSLDSIRKYSALMHSSPRIETQAGMNHAFALVPRMMLWPSLFEQAKNSASPSSSQFGSLVKFKRSSLWMYS